MHSTASTVADYLSSLPEERRQTISKVRDRILRSLPSGLVETMACGMISYVVPSDKSPKNCNGQPMMLIGLSSGKQYCSLHLMSLYMNKPAEEALRQEFERIGKKLRMGKACVQFQTAADLPLDAIGRLVAKTNPEAFLKMYQASHSKEAVAERRSRRKAAAK